MRRIPVGGLLLLSLILWAVIITVVVFIVDKVKEYLL